MGDEYGPWVPLDPVEVRRLLQAFSGRWWISGGWALDMFLGRKTRSHDDIDIGILYADVLDLRSALRGYDLHWAHDGVLTPWAPTAAPAPEDQGHNLWARPAPDQAWAVDFMLNPGDGSEWVYKRNPSVTRSWDDAVLHTGDGLPYLAPELQLLLKAMSSAGTRPKDDADAALVIPLLDEPRRAWLREHLPEDHPWEVTTP